MGIMARERQRFYMQSANSQLYCALCILVILGNTRRREFADNYAMFAAITPRISFTFFREKFTA